MKLIAILFGAVWVGVAIARVLWGLLVEAWKLRPTHGSTTEEVLDLALKRRNRAERLALHAEIFGVDAMAEYDALRRLIIIRCRQCHAVVASVDFDLSDSFDEASQIVGFGAVQHVRNNCTPVENYKATTTVLPIEDTQSETTENLGIRKIRFDKKV